MTCVVVATVWLATILTMLAIILSMMMSMKAPSPSQDSPVQRHAFVTCVNIMEPTTMLMTVECV